MGHIAAHNSRGGAKVSRGGVGRASARVRERAPRSSPGELGVRAARVHCGDVRILAEHFGVGFAVVARARVEPVLGARGPPRAARAVEELHPRVGLDEGVLCCPELSESDGEDAQSKLCSIADGEEEADQESDLVQYSGKFKDEGHGFRNQSTQIQVLEETEAFFRKHLGLDALPEPTQKCSP